MTCYIEHIDFYLHYRSFCRSKRKSTVTNETVNTMHRPQTEYVKIIAPDMKANGQKKKYFAFEQNSKPTWKTLNKQEKIKKEKNQTKCFFHLILEMIVNHRHLLVNMAIMHTIHWIFFS